MERFPPSVMERAAAPTPSVAVAAPAPAEAGIGEEALMSPITPYMLGGARDDSTQGEEANLTPRSAPISSSSAPAGDLDMRNGFMSPFTPKILGNAEAAPAPPKDVPRIIKLNVGGEIFQTAAS